jgi:hypothetical protein
MATQNNNIDNLSDVRPDSGTQGNVSPQQLPIRGEKRIINAPISPIDANNEFEDAYFASGQTPPNVLGYDQPNQRQQLVEQNDFNVSAALSPYTDYILIRLFNRGLGGNGQPDGSPAVYRFLINPSQVVVNRTTLDGQAFARSGWQIGVWGEDSLSISLTGKTAGQYFSFGLTDKYQPFTESYRNLEQLQVVFENNGYWFEGEQAAEGPLGAPFNRRIIKMHSDVELIVGNFIWSGMFESLTLSQDAQTPFLMNFQINFIAWKERFRKQSPYKDTIHNDVKRGHDYGTWQSAALATQQASQTLGAAQSVALTPNSAVVTATPLVFETTPSPITGELVPPAQPAPVNAAVQAAEDANTYSQVDPTANDTTYMPPALNPFSPQNFGTWNGIISPLTIGNGGKTV